MPRLGLVDAIRTVALMIGGLAAIHPEVRADVGPQWIAFNRAGAPSSSLQCFTPENVHVLDGNLAIETKAEPATCSSFDLAPARYRFTSGFVAMRSFHFLYGTVEFRAKFGGGSQTGAWPAVWMADASCQASDPDGTDDDCNGEEIDIAEILGGNFEQVNQQIHVDHFAHNDGCSASISDTSRNFHVYQLVWTARSLVFKIDRKTTCTIEQHIPHAPMYVKINMNVGALGGPVELKSLPWHTRVDYLKVTQGENVVFRDDFDQAATIQAAPAHTPSSHDKPVAPDYRGFRRRWIVLAGVSGLLIAWVLAARRFRGSPHQ